MLLIYLYISCDITTLRKSWRLVFKKAQFLNLGCVHFSVEWAFFYCIYIAAWYTFIISLFTIWDLFFNFFFLCWTFYLTFLFAVKSDSCFLQGIWVMWPQPTVLKLRKGTAAFWPVRSCMRIFVEVEVIDGIVKVVWISLLAFVLCVVKTF